MSCGCQKRILPNGKTGCSKCITNNNTNIKPKTSNNVAPIVNEDIIITDTNHHEL